MNRATAFLGRFLSHSRSIFWRREAWRGVNLGGWLLLEPGPSSQLFEEHGGSAACEWALMRNLVSTRGAAKASEIIRMHRETYITEEDFRQIRACGLNAV